jgi:hypothetical protein
MGPHWGHQTHRIEPKPNYPDKPGYGLNPGRANPTEMISGLF